MRRCVVPGFVIQNFTGGTLNLYDPSNTLLLSGLLTHEQPTGNDRAARNGRVFSTNLATVTGGFLAQFIVPGSLALSMNLTNVNGGAVVSL